MITIYIKQYNGKRMVCKGCSLSFQQGFCLLAGKTGNHSPKKTYHSFGRVVQMKLIENFINHKISTITGDELLKFARQFQLEVTKEQAEKIAAYLRKKQINIFNTRERVQLIKEIAKVSGPEVAKEVNRLFVMFTK